MLNSLLVCPIQAAHPDRLYAMTKQDERTVGFSTQVDSGMGIYDAVTKVEEGHVEVVAAFRDARHPTRNCSLWYA